ncbi:MAG: Tfx family DNA-binding protein [Sulfolobales archaeon]
MGKLNTYLTQRQIAVLKLLSQGKSVDEIANLLGVSKSDVYSLIRSARKVVDKSFNTIRLYNQIMNNSSIVVNKGTTINGLIYMLLNEANKLKIKLPLTTAELVLKLIKSVDSNCIDLTESKVNCDLILYLDSVSGITIGKDYNYY